MKIIGHFAVKGSVIIPLQLIGYQKFMDQSLELFNIKEPVKNPLEGFEHPKDSTLTRETLERYGYRIV